ncbi:MAG: hypothetical protein ACM3X0_14180 [Bacteroidota bacterium]
MPRGNGPDFSQPKQDTGRRSAYGDGPRDGWQVIEKETMWKPAFHADNQEAPASKTIRPGSPVLPRRHGGTLADLPMIRQVVFLGAFV